MTLSFLIRFFKMWKAAAGTNVNFEISGGDADDWETDPDFEVSTLKL